MLGLVGALALSASAFAQSPTVSGYSEAGANVLPAPTVLPAPAEVSGQGERVLPGGGGAVSGSPSEETSAAGTTDPASAGPAIRTSAARTAGRAGQASAASTPRADLSALPFTGSDLVLLLAAALALLGAGICLRRAVHSPRREPSA